jgi:ABC-type antimicrobial peptide transport system permease subunit
VGFDRVLSTIELCLLVFGVALLGGSVGWIAGARKHRQRRWPAAATGVVIAVSALYTCALFLTLTALGRWNF